VSRLYRRTLATLLDGPDRTRRAAAIMTEVGTPRALLNSVLDGSLPSKALSARERRRLRSSLTFVAQAINPPRVAPIRAPQSAVRSIARLWVAAREEVWGIAVDSQLRPIAQRQLAQGCVDRSQVVLAQVLGWPIAVGARGLFLLHNHPGGSTAPSESDLELTRVLQGHCDALDILFHDHIIVAGKRWTSCLSGLSGPWFPTLPTSTEGA